MEVGVAGVLAFGAEGDEEVDPRPEPGRGQHRQDDVAGSAGVGGAFEDDELARAKALHDRLGRLDDEAEVGLAGVGQRRRHADDDDVGLMQMGELAGRLEPGREHLRDLGIRDVLEVAAAGPEKLDLAGIDVEAEDGKAAESKGPAQRQPDVAEADDADLGLTALDAGRQVRTRHRQTSTGSSRSGARSQFSLFSGAKRSRGRRRRAIRGR